MTIQRIVKKNIGASDPTTYVGNPGDIFLDSTIPILKLSDGSTPGGLSLGGAGTQNLAITLQYGNNAALGINVGPSTFSSVYVSGISTFADDVHFDYNAILKIGDNDDLQIYHNGSNAYIDNFSGNNLVIRDNGAGIQLRRYGGGPNAGLMANFNTGAGVELYYDSVLKLQTFQNGVAINDSVGIGSTAGNPPYRLTVSGVGATVTSGLVNAIADLTSSVNGYGQVNIRNSFAGSNSSGDLVVTANNGSDTTNYIDLGINNSSFSNGSWTINGAGDGYLYTSDTNLSIGVAATNKYLSLFAGGTLAANEKVRVTSSGVSITGVLTATQFVGDGSGLTGITASVTYVPNAGIATYASTSGVATYATSSGIATYASTSGVATYASTSGVSTTAGYATTAGISTVAQGLTGTPNINVGVLTATSAIIGSAVTITSGGVRTSGIVTAYSFRPTSGYIQASDGTNSFYIYSATGNVSFQGNINVNQINSGSGYTGLTFSGGSTPTVQIPNSLNVTGITTSTGGFVGNLTGTATTSTTSGYATTAGISTTSQGLTGTPNINVSVATATSFVKSGGTSSQFLKADGSIDSSAYATQSYVGLATAGLLSNTGSASSLTGLTGAAANTYGNATTVPQIVVDANGRITSISNVVISGGGGGTSIIVKDDGSVVGSAGTIDFGTGLTVTPLSVGIVTVNATYVPIAGYSTSSGVSTSSSYATIAGYSTSSGIATNATSASYATIAGYSTSSGVSTTSNYATIAGYSTSSGIATNATNATTASYATIAGYSTSSGISTYSTSSGVSTSVIGGISSVTQLSVSGVSTFNGSVGIGTTNAQGSLQIGTGVTIYGSSGNATFSGVVTATSFQSLSAGTPTIDSPNNININAVTVAISTDATVGRELRVAGITTINAGGMRVAGIVTITGGLNAPGNYYVKLARLTNQTIPTGTDTLIGFTTMSDTNGWYAGITTRTTPTIAGSYQVQVMLNWQAGATTNANQSNIQLRKNGNTFAISIVGIQTFQYSQFICGIVTMNGSTDYIDFTAYTSNATSQAVTGDASGLYTKMEIFKLN